MVECSTRDGRLDLLIGDTPILDYYRANDPGCTLRTVDVIEEDNYAVGMSKGLRLQVLRNLSSILEKEKEISGMKKKSADSDHSILIIHRVSQDDTSTNMRQRGFRSVKFKIIKLAVKLC